MPDKIIDAPKKPEGCICPWSTKQGIVFEDNPYCTFHHPEKPDAPIPKDSLAGTWMDRANELTIENIDLKENIAQLEAKPTAPIPKDYIYKTSEEAELLPLPLQILRLKEINAELCRNHNTLVIANARLEAEKQKALVISPSKACRCSCCRFLRLHSGESATIID